jgi:hypothetical protein
MTLADGIGLFLGIAFAVWILSSSQRERKRDADRRRSRSLQDRVQRHLDQIERIEEEAREFDQFMALKAELRAKRMEA